jgi:hypothetical protein
LKTLLREREWGVGWDMHPVENNIKMVQSEFLGQKFWQEKKIYHCVAQKFLDWWAAYLIRHMMK